MSSRPDLRLQLSNPKFLFELGLAFLLSLSALALSTFLSRPGHEGITRRLEKLTFGILAFVLIYDGVRVAQLSQSQIHLGLNLSGLECFAVVLGYSVILGAALMLLLRKGASASPRLSGLVIGTACVALGNIAITFFCGVDNGMHTFIWHFLLPIGTAVGISILASRLLLKW